MDSLKIERIITTVVIVSLINSTEYLRYKSNLIQFAKFWKHLYLIMENYTTIVGYILLFNFMFIKYSQNSCDWNVPLYFELGFSKVTFVRLSIRLSLCRKHFATRIRNT